MLYTLDEKWGGFIIIRCKLYFSFRIFLNDLVEDYSDL